MYTRTALEHCPLTLVRSKCSSSLLFALSGEVEATLPLGTAL